MTWRTLLSSAAVAVLLMACGDNNGNGNGDGAGELADTLDTAPACDQLFAPGQPTDDVVDAAVGEGSPGVCEHSPDEFPSTALASFPCPSDPARTVYYTGSGYDGWASWGVTGGTWQAMPDGQDAPPADAC